ncbi:MAG: hypothetical protein WCC06_06770 [Candidatus Aminicenantales bacterium]
MVLRRKKIFIVCALGLVFSFTGLAGESPLPERNPAEFDPGCGRCRMDGNGGPSEKDGSSIDCMVKALYESITFPEGKEPDWERLRALFTPDAPFIRINKDGSVDRMTTESFILSFQERMRKGSVKSFHESELFRRTQVFGQMAHVFSTYRKDINMEDPEKFVKGINSLQLFYDGKDWRIGSIVWMDERSDCLIPSEYLR